jgi:hypothetical protein
MTIGFGLKKRTIICAKCGKEGTGFFYPNEKYPHAECSMAMREKYHGKGQKGTKDRARLTKEERVFTNWQIFKIFTEGITAPLPVTGHLQGGIDKERMKKIAAEIEAREAGKGSHADLRA